MIKKQENILKEKCVAVLRQELPKYVVQVHQQVVGSGTPDLSIIGVGRTSWLEFKHATPDFESRGIQELQMLRLAAAGFARYIIWWEDGKSPHTQRTLIVHPRYLKDYATMFEDSCVGFNHRFLADYVRKIHAAV